MKQYYIISIKHTSRADKALTFWRPNGKGYAWHRDQCGLYGEDVIHQYTSDDNVAVLKETVDPLWCDADDHGTKYISLPNTTVNRKKLGISNRLMKPARSSTCRMIFVNSPVLAIVLFLTLISSCSPRITPCPKLISGDTVPSKILISAEPPAFGHSIDGYCVYRQDSCTGRHLKFWHKRWIVIGPEYTVWKCIKRINY